MEARQKLESLLDELSKANSFPRLSAAVDDVDQVIQLLSDARDQIAEAMDPHTASLTMTRLQNPVKFAFGKVNDDLKAASSAHKKVGRSLDKYFPLKQLPTDNDAMGNHLPLINRAIAMHLLREGQFSVASTFISEVQGGNPQTSSAESDEPMDEDNGEEEVVEDRHYASSDGGPNAHGDEYDLSSLHSQELQDKFAQMYTILQHLKVKNLLPAIDWARSNSAELEARGSNLEFELSKLQYVWLFQGPTVNNLPDDEHNGRSGALAYARQHFGRFQARHLREIQQLASAMVFAPNLQDSPYHDTFAISDAFTDVATSFTREFCSLLGLSAESPLYLAVTAGALALPRLMKYMLATRSKGTEWTTAEELPFETPLPQSMLFHSIFVCPVSKEQTTKDNPPMVIPCGHMLAEETLKKLSRGTKGTRFKCPYCPSEASVKDARKVVL
ncbi:CTLH/CRA C-terminal to lish motif domain-containing protein [Corynascus similis CBS 632.67]